VDTAYSSARVWVPCACCRRPMVVGYSCVDCGDREAPMWSRWDAGDVTAILLIVVAGLIACAAIAAPAY
jgi:hypothetical protein